MAIVGDDLIPDTDVLDFCRSLLGIDDRVWVQTLVYILGGGIEDTQHGYNAITRSVGSSNMTFGCSDVVDMQPDSARPFADKGTVFQGVINPVDAVVFHGQKKAGAQLWTRSPCVEQGRRGMGEIFLRHQIVGSQGTLDVVSVNSERDTHPHVLGSLDHLSVDSHQIRTLQCFESKVIKDVVTRIIDPLINLFLIRFDGIEQLLCYKRPMGIMFVFVIVKHLHHRDQTHLGVFVVI